MEELKVMVTHFSWVGRRQLLDAPTRVQSDGIKVILKFLPPNAYRLGV